MMPGLFVVDISVMVGMLVLANLSSRYGDAMKIPPYHRILYVTTAIVFLAFGVDTFRESLRIASMDLVTIGMRALAGAVALVVCLPYWRWLFSEFFHTRK
jgi:hypothetical protein